MSLVHIRLQDSKQAKRQRVEVPAGEGRAFLPAPEGMAVGPAHLVRQHGQPPRAIEPSIDTAAAPAAHSARPVTASWPRTVGPPPSGVGTSATPHRAVPAAAAGESRSGSAERKQPPEPAAAAPAPRRTLADLAKQSRLAASRAGGGADADPLTAGARLPPHAAVVAKAAAGGQSSAAGVARESLPAKRPPEEDLAVYVRRLKAELPPGAHAAVLGHLAAYRYGPAKHQCLLRDLYVCTAKCSRTAVSLLASASGV